MLHDCANTPTRQSGAYLGKVDIVRIEDVYRHKG